MCLLFITRVVCEKEREMRRMYIKRDTDYLGSSVPNQYSIGHLCRWSGGRQSACRGV